MSDVVADLQELSEPWQRGDKIKRAIERAAKAAGLTYTRTWDIWYRKARRVDPAELESIANALDKKRREARRNEFLELRDRLNRLETMLAISDPDFTRPDRGAIGDQIRAMGGRSGAAHRPVDADQDRVGSASRRGGRR